MKNHRFIVSLALCGAFFATATAREYSGVVVSKDNNNTPVAGVLVSVGHSEYYTRTDQNGRFSITNATTAISAERSVSKAPESQMARWNFRGRALDLNSAPAVASASVYTVNGKRVFNGRIPASRVVDLRGLATGAYLLELRGEHGVLDRAQIVLANKAATSFTIGSALRGGPRLAKSAQVSDAVSELLIFRHDNYLPKDSAMTNSNTNMRIELKTDERAPVFDQSRVHEYRITMSQADLNYMNTYGYREEIKEAELTYNNERVPGKVGVRYKGSNYTLPRCFFPNGDTTRGNPNKTCNKISMKIKFTQYDQDRRFYGMKKINLHAMTAYSEPTKMHEMLSYELFRDMGIHAPRTSYANVYVNNRLIGLFCVVEEVDGRFTKSRWPGSDHGDGNLYKEVWPKSSDRNYYLGGLKTNNGQGENPSVQRMVEYYNAVNSSNEQNVAQKLSPYMDFDYFLRYLVVDVAIKNWDGMRSWYIDHLGPGPINHNYYYYEEEAQNGGKIWIIPWDMDQALVERDSYFDAGGAGGFPGGGWGGGGGQPLPQWNVSTTNCGGQQVGEYRFMPPNCDKLTKLMAGYWPRYVQLGDLFLRDIFVSSRLNEKINRHQNLINSAVQQDPDIQQGTWTNGVNSLKNYLPNNISSFRSYLHP
jgi:spore coat protein CotH